MSAVTVDLPPRLQQSAEALVASGWFNSMDALLEEAVRRYVESHSDDLMTRFVEEDVRWGLFGEE